MTLTPTLSHPMGEGEITVQLAAALGTAAAAARVVMRTARSRIWGRGMW